MKESDYWNKLNEELAKFPPDFKDKLKINPQANAVIEMLIRGANPYDVINTLIGDNESATNVIHRIFMLNNNIKTTL